LADSETAEPHERQRGRPAWYWTYQWQYRSSEAEATEGPRRQRNGV